jgi:NurA-like 5'-3' nuclease
VLILYLYEPRNQFRTKPFIWRGLAELISHEDETFRIRLPPYLELNNFYMNRLGIIDFYIRLARDKPILKVQIALDMLEHGTDLFDREFIDSIVEKTVRNLLYMSDKTGYPWKLVEADKTAKVTPSEAKGVLSILGFQLERSTRSRLGV